MGANRLHSGGPRLRRHHHQQRWVEAIPGNAFRRLVFWSAYVLNGRREGALEMLPDSIELLTQMAGRFER